MSKPSQPMLGKFLLNWCHPDPIPNFLWVSNTLEWLFFMLVCQNLTQPSSFTWAWDRLCWDDSGERESLPVSIGGVTHSQSFLKRIPEKTSLTLMVLNPGSLVIQDLWEGVSPKRDCCHGVNELCTFISKFNFIASESFPPVDVLVMQQSLYLLFD